MRKYFARKIFVWFWPEIRLFARWTMHSGNCTQAITEKDYQRFLFQKKQWIKHEECNQSRKEAIGAS
jgi:hypothetical protein